MFLNHIKLTWLCIFVIGGHTNLAFARLLLVPAEYQLISSAIESTEEGDTILVSPGNYSDSIVVRTNITIASLYLTTADTAYVDSTIISGTGEGSVFMVAGPNSPNIVGFKIMGGNASYGGGIVIRSNATPTIKRCIITECESGISVITGAAPLIEDCRILNNGSDNSGDGLYFRDDSEATVRNTLISGNQGSGLYCRNNPRATLENCVIERNQSQGIHLINSSPRLINCLIRDNFDDIVGGIYLRAGSNAVLTRCTISGNEGDAFGGVLCYQSAPSFDHCRIVDNIGGSVGGVKCSVGSAPYFVDCLIRGNIGIGNGGGINIDNSRPIFSNCEISDNLSGEGCAGITMNESTALFLKCLIYDHHSPALGGAFYITDSNPTLKNCTLVRNSADNGAAIYFEGEGTFEVINSILWFNSLPSMHFNHGGNQNDGKTLLDVSYSDVEGGENSVSVHGEVSVIWGKGNIDADPLFADLDNENFQLTEQSPCIDTGSPYSPHDRDGTIADMGKFYYPQANISISVDSLIFDDIYAGQIDSLFFDISNLGEAALTIEDIRILPDRAPFTLSSAPTPHNIEAQATVRYWIRFEPDYFGEYHALMIINSNDRRQGRFRVFIAGETLNVPDKAASHPSDLSISQIYPNPFNSNATLKFYTPLRQEIKIDLIDISGRIVHAFPPRSYSAGSHSLMLPIVSVNAGVYFLRIQSLQAEHVQKIVSIR